MIEVELQKNVAENLKAVLEEARSMDAREVKAFHHIPLKNVAVVVDALEKQIPKKPNLWGDGYADGVLVYDMYDCPNCDKHYELDYEKYDYCPNCGQKFDWSD